MSSTDIDTKKRWYVIRVQAGYEKQVTENLRAAIEKEELQDHFGDIITPAEEVLEIRQGKQKKVPRKFFPGYILVNVAMSSEVMRIVRQLRQKNAWGFLGTGDHPVPLSQREVDDIFGRLSSGEGKPKPKVLFQPGQRVEIVSGPFAGFKGVVEEADYEKRNRLRVSVVVFQRVTSVELEFNEVKTI